MGANDVRVIRLVRSPCRGVIGDSLSVGVLPRPSLIPDQGVLGGRLVDGVRDPGVPAWLDLCPVSAVG